MANKIILKKSAVASKAPTESDLDYGELALNYTDGKLYYKNSTNLIAAFNASTGETLEHGSFYSKTITVSANLGEGFVVDSFPLAEYRSGKYQLQIQNGNGYHGCELLVIHNDGAVNTVQYADILMGNPAADVSAVINGADVDIIITPLVSDDTVVVLVATLTRNYGSSFMLDMMSASGTEDLMVGNEIIDLQA
jgi:hypothetical protein